MHSFALKRGHQEEGSQRKVLGCLGEGIVPRPHSLDCYFIMLSCQLLGTGEIELD